MPANPSNTEHVSIADAHFADVLRLETAQTERRAALDLVAGEVSHEVVHTMLFLRYLTEGAKSRALSPEDAALARKEIERLQRMLSHLRQLTMPPPAREPVRVIDIFRRAKTEVQSLLSAKQVSVAIDVAEPLTVRTDVSLFALLARDLLAAVVRDADLEGVVDVHAATPNSQGDGAVEVRISIGREEPEPVAPDNQFDPWEAMRSANLGLASSYRVARTLGWKLLKLNGEGRFGLRVLIPAALFCSESAP